MPLAASLNLWPHLAGSWGILSSPTGSKRERLDLSLRLLWRFPGSCHSQNLQIFQSASLLGGNPPKTVVATHCSAPEQPCLYTTGFSKQGSPLHPGQGQLSTSLKMFKCDASGRPAAASRCFLGCLTEHTLHHHLGQASPYPSTQRQVELSPRSGITEFGPGARCQIVEIIVLFLP